MTTTEAIAITTGTTVELGSAIVRVTWTGYGDRQVTLGYTWAGAAVSATMPENALVRVVEGV
jgi:hypothetical protein